ncbi:MAG TPA: methyl-accepting chemotaxis protein [Macromonas sp.]|nr:methyl-accepting chemotaxis protein [Macromonas sp.]
MNSALSESEFGAASLATVALHSQEGEATAAPQTVPLQVKALARQGLGKGRRLLPALLFTAVLLSIAAAFWSMPSSQGVMSLSSSLSELLVGVEKLADSAETATDAVSNESQVVMETVHDVTAARASINALSKALSAGGGGGAQEANVRQQVRVAEQNAEAAFLKLQSLGMMQVQSLDEHFKLQRDNLDLRNKLKEVQQAYASEWSTNATDDAVVQGWFIFATVLALILSVQQWRAGLARQAEVDRVRSRALADAEKRRAEAQQQEQEAKRINEATQAAILRLMNELQTVAEGDLTQQTTVTEDVTGAIADSINYTVEELRSLVQQVQGTVERVTITTEQVENTSLELLAVSNEQLREIRDTGQAVLEMASRITQVSTQAQASMDAARQARAAAESGAQAVQETIGGMNSIREQIQDTAKRIKRLGESSQEIGEITELISDITEQTNVLALNAAIQAAAAGEAGRGFSVVAEEVQRLAERSADATRQIATLVRAIQGDTQDAVLAMELSTRGVVDGARLTDNAGSALTDIESLSRQVADLIELIAQSAAQDAVLAGQTANNIQHIFAVAEQTGQGTRSTVEQVRELTRVADELRQSVARFKIV